MSVATPKRRISGRHFRWRRLRLTVAYTLALVVILAGTAVGLAERLLPFLAQHPERVAQWLSERIGQPIGIGSVDAHWSRSGPLLALRGLRIGTGSDTLNIGSAQLAVNVYSGLWPGTPFTELHIDGLDLNLTRDTNGHWRLEGFTPTNDGAASAFNLEKLNGIGALEVFAARLRVQDESDGRELMIERADARMQRAGSRIEFGLRAFRKRSAGSGDAMLRIAGDVSRDGLEGQLYLEGLGQDWAPWTAALPFHGLHIARAEGDLRMWIDIAEGQIARTRLQAELSPLALQGEGTNDAPAPGIAFNRFSTRMQWQRESGGWRVDVPETIAELADEGPVFEAPRTAAEKPRHATANNALWRTAPPNVPTIADLRIDARSRTGTQDAQYRVQANTLMLEPFLALVAATDLLPEEWRDTLVQTRPEARLSALALDFTSPDQFALSANLADTGWRATRRIPSLRGVAGKLDADPNTFRLQLAPQHWKLDAPGMLRSVLTPDVHGEIVAWREALDEGNTAWHVETDALSLREADQYEITLAGGASFGPDASLQLSLRADVGDAPIVVAKRFFPHAMPPETLQWLDDALIDGRLRHGIAIFHGDPRDWPFETAGRFSAQADIDELRLRYQDDWPDGEALKGIARFVNNGFDADLSGRVGKVEIKRVYGGIERYAAPWLNLSIQAQGGGSALLDVLRRSPIGQHHHDILDGLSIGGQGDVSLELRVPLQKELGELGLDGYADLSRADLAHREWGIAFDAASGRVRFSERGFSADELNVGFGDSLGALSVAIGGYTADASNAVEASLRGHFSAARMIDSAPHAGWLKPWLTGASDWTVTLTVPPSESGHSTPKLRLRSDLSGTAITLPAPLRKDEKSRLPLDLSLQLPMTRGTIDLRLGQLLRLTGNITPEDGLTGVARFGDAPDATPPARGVHLAGQVPVLDGNAWLGVATAGSGGNGLFIASADIHAGELDFLGRAFRETRMRFIHHEGIRVDFDFAGPMLAGELQVPLLDLARRGITAHLDKLIWTTAPADAGTLADRIPPQSVPPLHLEIADLEFAGAKLGAARIETQPTPRGLRVERIEAHSPDLTLRMEGEWTLADGAESTGFSADLSSNDLGRMLEALGFSRLVDGGPSLVKLAARWPGGPDEFEYAKLGGELSATIGQGRVLEVEPGVGRMFGLLSLTEIPRRLTLDFTDFFKSGFAFNQMQGSFSIEEGVATTDDLRIDAPSAEIRITGQTSLPARDYNQRMEVLPKASNVLPALGAIAGGPAGAAVGAVAQAILQNPLKQMTRTVYQVQGPWSEPKIDRIERGTVNHRTPAP